MSMTGYAYAVCVCFQDKVDVLPTAHSNPQSFEWLLLRKSALEEHTYLDFLIAHGWYNPKFLSSELSGNFRFCSKWAALST